MRRNGDGQNGRGAAEPLPEDDQGDQAARLVAKYVAEQHAAALAPERSAIGGGEMNGEPTFEEHSSDAMSVLRCQVESMFAELKAHRERVDRLAWALGACCLCWGMDTECRICRGRGRPGFALPDEELFGELVLPAVRALRAQGEKRNGFAGQLPPRVTESGADRNAGTHHHERNAP